MRSAAAAGLADAETAGHGGQSAEHGGGEIDPKMLEMAGNERRSE